MALYINDNASTNAYVNVALCTYICICSRHNFDHTPAGSDADSTFSADPDNKIFANMSRIGRALYDQCDSVPAHVYEPVYYDALALMYTAVFAVSLVVSCVCKGFSCMPQDVGETILCLLEHPVPL